MQIKKDELYQMLLANAEEEFFEKGFAAGSLRAIAKKSGTTIGNLYHYFDSKEALFEALVKDEYAGFKSLIQNHNGMEQSEQALAEKDIGVWRGILKNFIITLSPIFTKRFYLLVNCSGGTKYESARQELLEVMKEHFIEHLKESRSTCPEQLGSIISEQVLSSILAIIRDYKDEEKKNALIVEIILFTIIGLIGILES